MSKMITSFISREELRFFQDLKRVGAMKASDVTANYTGFTYKKISKLHEAGLIGVEE